MAITDIHKYFRNSKCFFFLNHLCDKKGNDKLFGLEM